MADHERPLCPCGSHHAVANPNGPTDYRCQACGAMITGWHRLAPWEVLTAEAMAFQYEAILIADAHGIRVDADGVPTSGVVEDADVLVDRIAGRY